MKAKNTPKSPQHHIFISWSGELSKALADIFYKWLKGNFPQFKPFFSEEHIDAGTKWREEIETPLRQCRMIVAFVTQANVGGSSWMLYEMGAVGSREGSNRVAVVLAGLTKDEFSERSDNPFAERHCTSFADKKAVLNLLHSIGACCPAGEIIHETQVETLFGGNEGWEKLSENWQKAFNEHRSDGLNLNPVKDSFSDDIVFREWANNYHHIIHFARHACVRVLAQDRVFSKEAVQKRLKEGLPVVRRKTDTPRHHLVLNDHRIRSHFKDMLNFMEKVFEQAVGQAGAKVWVCLRDLRSNGKYYTLDRSFNSPDNNAQNSVPWESTCGAIRDLKKTCAGQKCATFTNEIDYSNPDSLKCWAPFGGNRPAEHRPAAMMIGAVLTKYCDDSSTDPENADLCFVLCVSCNKPGVFSDVHLPLLQGCNDAFSAIANTIVTMHRPPAAYERGSKGASSARRRRG